MRLVSHPPAKGEEADKPLSPHTLMLCPLEHRAVCFPCTRPSTSRASATEFAPHAEYRLAGPTPHRGPRESRVLSWAFTAGPDRIDCERRGPSKEHPRSHAAMGG